MSTPNPAAAVAAFQKILNQPKMQRSNRTPAEIQESIRRLRRLILVEGIPQEAVSHFPGCLEVYYFMFIDE